MKRLPRHSGRWNLRRTLLGVALVLHVAWLTPGMMAVASAAAQAPSTTAAGHAMPCHDGMSMDDMSMHDMSMVDQDLSGPAARPGPLKHAPAHLPCCAQICACATGLCAVSALQPQNMRALVRYRQPPAAFTMLVSRAPTPELRPPILH